MSRQGKAKITCQFDADWLSSIKHCLLWAQLHGEDTSLTKICREALDDWAAKCIKKHGKPSEKLKRGGDSGPGH